MVFLLKNFNQKELATKIKMEVKIKMEAEKIKKTKAKLIIIQTKVSQTLVRYHSLLYMKILKRKRRKLKKTHQKSSNIVIIPHKVFLLM